jgi:hypothetical protein
VRRQLLGEPAGRHHQWGLERNAVSLYQELDRRGRLDPAVPSQR